MEPQYEYLAILIAVEMFVNHGYPRGHNNLRRDIGFHDVKRASSVSKLYTSYGVLVTNQDYLEHARIIAREMNIIFTYPSNIVNKLDKHVNRINEMRNYFTLKDTLAIYYQS
ncbi:8070_t:CDS:2 [Scutellospora calospora]|uniref:8070_t:CDS:1 n=1 Tax=Scutellospora calospora TaxID=85575 RepID=A0ACA9JUL4_9GLOM|nr:8070_t:CDS:2 [Scutellospora calospora]